MFLLRDIASSNFLRPCTQLETHCSYPWNIQLMALSERLLNLPAWRRSKYEFFLSARWELCFLPLKPWRKHEAPTLTKDRGIKSVRSRVRKPIFFQKRICDAEFSLTYLTGTAWGNSLSHCFLRCHERIVMKISKDDKYGLLKCERKKQKQNKKVMLWKNLIVVVYILCWFNLIS